MPKSVQITLTTAGTNLGPTLDLFCITQSGVSLTPFETAVPLALLVSGYTTIVGDNCIGVRVKSNGICTTFADISILSPTTTTTTSTTSTTTTTTQCPCSVYLLTGNTPVVLFSFVQCGSVLDAIDVPLGFGQTAIYCIDNAQGISVSGDGTYNQIGTQCCTPGSITTTTSTSTTSTTTTTTSSLNFEISNQTSFGTIESVTPEFYTIVNTSGGTSYGTHSGYSGIISVNINDSNPGTVTLYINGGTFECITTTGSGTYSFSPVVINSGDLVNIIYSYGICL